MSHSITNLPVSHAAFSEISKKLRDAGYHDALHGTGIYLNGLALALVSDAPPADDAFSIERGFPMPSLKRGRKGPMKYPFEKMAVGDSFVVPVPDGTALPYFSSCLRSVAYQWSRREKNGSVRFSLRAVEDKSAVRVWRVA